MGRFTKIRNFLVGVSGFFGGISAHIATPAVLGPTARYAAGLAYSAFTPSAAWYVPEMVSIAARVAVQENAGFYATQAVLPFAGPLGTLVASTATSCAINGGQYAYKCYQENKYMKGMQKSAKEGEQMGLEAMTDIDLPEDWSVIIKANELEEKLPSLQAKNMLRLNA